MSRAVWVFNPAAKGLGGTLTKLQQSHLSRKKQRKMIKTRSTNMMERKVECDCRGKKVSAEEK